MGNPSSARRWRHTMPSRTRIVNNRKPTTGCTTSSTRTPPPFVRKPSSKIDKDEHSLQRRSSRCLEIAESSLTDTYYKALTRRGSKSIVSSPESFELKLHKTKDATLGL